jgi:hypothetical protein
LFHQHLVSLHVLVHPLEVFDLVFCQFADRLQVLDAQL